MTFASTTNAILHLGAEPKLVDVEPATGLIDPAAVRAAIGERTVGILPVHLYGQLADMRALRAIADQRGLFVVEDSAHGIEMERDGVRPGDLGRRGGLLVLRDEEHDERRRRRGGDAATRSVAERLRRLRNHGVSKAATERHGGLYQHWDLVELGYKANLTDLDAALLRPQLAHVEAQARAARADRAPLRVAPARAHRRPDDAAADGARRPVARRARAGPSSHHLFTIHAWPGERDAHARAGSARRGIGTAVNYRAIHTLTYLVEALAVPRGALPGRRGDRRPHDQPADVPDADATTSRTASSPPWPRHGRAGRAQALTWGGVCLTRAARSGTGGGRRIPRESMGMELVRSLR